MKIDEVKAFIFDELCELYREKGADEEYTTADLYERPQCKNTPKGDIDLALNELDSERLIKSVIRREFNINGTSSSTSHFRFYSATQKGYSEWRESKENPITKEEHTVYAPKKLPKSRNKNKGSAFWKRWYDRLRNPNTEKLGNILDIGTKIGKFFYGIIVILATLFGWPLLDLPTPF